jgi:hypothetical protein
VSEPTAGEQALAKSLGLDANAMAAAREVLNTIAFLPWPRPERVSLLARLARAAKADVGRVLGAMALDLAPVKSFDILMPVLGLAEKRVAGLVRALSEVDVATLSPDGASLREAWARVSALETENAALRAEVDRLYTESINTPTGSAPAPMVMRLGDMASSVSSQVAAVDDTLRTLARGLRLGGVQLRLKGAATALENDLALDLGAPAAGSEVGLAFVPAGSAASGSAGAPVPDVRGYTPALARRKLVASGFAVVFATMAGARGVVEEQSPAEGTIAAAGSVVRLIVR